jgi:hypothetical protein
LKVNWPRWLVSALAAVAPRVSVATTITPGMGVMLSGWTTVPETVWAERAWDNTNVAVIAASDGATILTDSTSATR